MKIATILAVGLVPLSIPFLAGGCVPQRELGLDDQDQEEELGQAEQAVLGDLACASGSFDFVDLVNTCDLEGGENCTHSTVGNWSDSYGDDWDDPETCQEYLVMKTFSPAGASGGDPKWVQYWAAPASALPTTQAACLNATLEVAGYYLNESGGQWQYAGQMSKTAEWEGGVCAFDGVAFYNKYLDCPGGLGKRNPRVAARYYVANGTSEPDVKNVVFGVFRTDL